CTRELPAAPAEAGLPLLPRSAANPLPTFGPVELDGEFRSLDKVSVGENIDPKEGVKVRLPSGTAKSAGGAQSGVTNDQRLKIIASVKQLLSLAGENAAPKTQHAVASVIIELTRLEDSLMQARRNFL